MAYSFGLLVVPVLLSIYVLYSFVASYWRLRHFKGPKLAAWTDFYFVWLSSTGRQHLILGELVDKHGSAHDPLTRQY